MSTSANLRKAKDAKDDEFYTRIEDIEKELKHYKKHFKGKVVFLNCDDPEWSNFWRFFTLKFEDYGLKKLISTHFERDKPSYKLEIVGDSNGDGKVNELDTLRTPLKQNGDFRSDECVELLKEADIVVTNPPFSLLREYLDLLIQHKKKFLFIGPKQAPSTKEVFPLVQSGKLWFGITSPSDFTRPEGAEKKKMGGYCWWFTNLTHKKRNEELILVREYSEEAYPKYDDCDVIHVGAAKEIPMDYEGLMGVPTTFLNRINTKQFEILGIDRYWDGNPNPNKRFFLEGKEKFARMIVRNKNI